VAGIFSSVLGAICCFSISVLFEASSLAFFFFFCCQASHVAQPERNGWFLFLFPCLSPLALFHGISLTQTIAEFCCFVGWFLKEEFVVAALSFQQAFFSLFLVSLPRLFVGRALFFLFFSCLPCIFPLFSRSLLFPGPSSFACAFC